MKDKRNNKVSLLIKQELSLICQKNLRDPRLQGVLIGDINLSNDMSCAKVYVSFADFDFLPRPSFPLEKDDSVSTSVKIKLLNKARVVSYLRTELARRINLRFTPTLVFYEDNFIEAFNNINNLSSSISASEEVSGDNCRK